MHEVAVWREVAAPHEVRPPPERSRGKIACVRGGVLLALHVEVEVEPVG